MQKQQQNPSQDQLYIDLIIDQQQKHKLNPNEHIENECITEKINNFNITDFINSNYDIKFKSLITHLKQMGFPFEGYDAFFYFTQGEVFVHCGTDPIEENIFIDKEIYFDKRQLRIKLREQNQFPILGIMQNAICNTNQNKEEELKVTNQNEKKESRRIKERKIGYIVQKVSQWRQFYTGVNQNGKIEKFSLDDAANKVGISKKSLDDYLLQIRYGHQFKFNFNEHKNDKVGILRAFVKRKKQEKK